MMARLRELTDMIDSGDHEGKTAKQVLEVMVNSKAKRGGVKVAKMPGATVVKESVRGLASEFDFECDGLGHRTYDYASRSGRHKHRWTMLTSRQRKGQVTDSLDSPTPPPSH